MIKPARIRAALLTAAAAGALAIGGSSVHAAPGDAAGAAQDKPAAGAAVAAVPVCGSLAATNAAVQTKVAYTSDASPYASTAWTNLACAAAAVTAPRGKRALIVAEVDAEVLCTGPVGQWCQGQVLIGNAPGAPSAPEPDSFAWAHATPAGAVPYEANTFTRSRVLACPATYPLAACTWVVRTQVRNHAAGMSFRVDDSTLHVTSTYF